MLTVIEAALSCAALFLLCYLGTGTDEKNLKSYSSYPDEVQRRVQGIAEYQGKFRESSRAVSFLSNLLLFLVVLYLLIALIDGFLLTLFKGTPRKHRTMPAHAP